MLTRALRTMSTIDLSLDRIGRLVTHFPSYTRPTIHVTGTNGKGSVTTIVASILRESGMKVGKFNSPHLLHPRDAIEIGGKPVELERYEEMSKRVQYANRHNRKGATPKNIEDDEIGASSFEVLTVTALQIFEEEQVDMAVIEVGMGGRLDATNILPQEGVVQVSAMTMVDLDHTRWLGSTISAIAHEKAGIARRGVPFVLGPQRLECTEEVERAVQKSVEEAGATIYPAARIILSEDQPSSSYGIESPPPPTKVIYTSGNQRDTLVLDLALRGSHQLENLSTALGIVECLQEKQGPNTLNPITTEAITQGVANTRWPGRLEFIQYTPKSSPPCVILLDGAHNASSAAALRQYINDILPNNNPNSDSILPTDTRNSVSFVLALSDSPPKLPADTLTPLLRPGDSVAAMEFSQVEDMPWVRPVDIQVIRNTAQHLIGETGKMWEGNMEASRDLPDLLISLENALNWAVAHSHGGPVVVAGSLYLVADFYRLMQASPHRFKHL